MINSEILAGKKSPSRKSKKQKEGSSPKRTSNNDSRYSSLCQKLEHLSKKLHDVDDEILAREDDDGSVSSGKKLPPASITTPSKDDGATDNGEEDEGTIAASILEEVRGTSANLNSFKMTPKMVA